MKNKKMIMSLAITLMAIGFASVSTVLYLNGQTFVASNTGDFDVYYSKAIENGVDKTSEVIQDKTHIEFTTELSNVGDTYVLDYDVTNGSKNYDANLVMNCVGGNEYLRVENRFDTTKVLPARTTRSGRLTLTVIKAVMTENRVSISCEISGNAVERDTAGGKNIDKEFDNNKDYLNFVGMREPDNITYLFILEKFGSYGEFDKYQSEVCSDYDSELCQDSMEKLQQEMENWMSVDRENPVFLWDNVDVSTFEEVIFLNQNNVPDNAVTSWDASEKKNGSIMAYTLDEDKNGLYELYIGQDGGVRANYNADYLFGRFKNLKSIKGLENFDTSQTMYMTRMFAQCDNLKSIDLRFFDTSKAVTMEEMFFGCISLNSLDVSKFNTKNVTNMSSMFQDCSNLTSLDLSNFNTKNVDNMSEMFSGCENLTSLNISSIDTNSVKNMSNLFANCFNLANLDVSHFDTANVINMENMFYYCSSLTNLDVSHFDTSKVENMSAMFFYCSGLKSLNVGHFNTNNVTDMRYMFAHCDGLTSLNIGQWNTRNVTNMEWMFGGCEKLENLDISEFDQGNVTDMSYMFYECNSLVSIKINEWNTSNVTNMEWMFYDCDKLNTTITIRGTKCTKYNNLFYWAADSEGAQITVNYTEDASDLVDKMIATKSNDSNVVKGSVVA